MIRHLLLAVAALGLLSLPPFARGARAAEPEQLKLARYNFEYGKYEEAVRLVDEVNAKKLLDEGPELVEAWRIHGLSLFYLGRRDDARSSFVKLLSIDPDHSLDPMLVPPLAVVEFDSVKKENEALLAPIRDRRRTIAEQVRLEQQARQRLLEEEERKRVQRDRDAGPVVIQRVERHNYLVNFLPFGVAQFEQGRPSVGALLAAGEALTTGLAIFTYAEYNDLLSRPGVARLGKLDDARRWRTLNWITFGATAAVYAVGVVDALRHFQEERVSYVAVPRDAPAPGSRPASTPYKEPPPKDAPPRAEAPAVIPFLAPTAGGATAGFAARF